MVSLSDFDQQSLSTVVAEDAIPTSALQEAIPDMQGKHTAHYDTEYGIRVDDGALVFHFFPPGYAVNSGVKWSNAERMKDALEGALVKNFEPAMLEGSYAEELQSFCVIHRPAPSVPDVNALLSRFFQDLDAALSGKASES